MLNHKKTFVFFVIVIVLLAAFVGVSRATTLSMTVPAGEEVTRTINLAVDDHVLIQFTVVGQAGNDSVTFSLIFPENVTIDFGETGDVSYNFVCKSEGNYTLRFVNRDLTESKLVILGYEVEHYLLGIPQMQFLVLLIAALCVGMVALHVLMSKRP